MSAGSGVEEPELAWPVTVVGMDCAVLGVWASGRLGVGVQRSPRATRRHLRVKSGQFVFATATIGQDLALPKSFASENEHCKPRAEAGMRCEIVVTPRDRCEVRQIVKINWLAI